MDKEAGGVRGEDGHVGSLAALRRTRPRPNTGDLKASPTDGARGVPGRVRGRNISLGEVRAVNRQEAAVPRVPARVVRRTAVSPGARKAGIKTKKE